MPLRFAHWPPKAVRLGFAERKPSGILSGTVLTDRDPSVSSSFPSRRSEADTSLLRPSSRTAKGIPFMKESSELGGNTRS
jgi:hypothetical protein